MITSWSLRLLTVMTGTLLIASQRTDTEELNENPTITLIEHSTPKLYSEKILEYGDNVTLSCKGKTPVTLIQQKPPEDGPSPFVMSERIISKYHVELDLYNVDRYAVGYYACHDDTIDSEELFTNILEEPKNTEHVSYMYLYVNDSSMFAPMRGFLRAISDSKFVIECRPTTPDIKVQLTSSPQTKTPTGLKFNPKIGFIFSKPVPKRIKDFTCVAWRGKENSSMLIRYDKAKAPEPVISGGNRYFLAGETISINCSVKLQDNIPIVMTWNNPKNTSKVRIESNEYDARETLINYYWIDNAGPGDAGRYECIANSNYDSGKAYFDKIFLDEPKISFTQTNDPRIETSAKILKLRVMIDDYPVSNVTVLKNNALPPPKVKFEVRRDKYNRGECLIKLTNLTVEDSGNYTIVARNQFLTNTSTYDVRVKGIPMVSFGKSNMQEFKFEKGTIATLTCNTIGYPQPQITWKFQYEGGEKVMTEDVTYIDSSVYRATSQLRLPVNIAGNVTCRASSGSFSNEATRPFIAYEMPNGFGIKNTEHTWFAQHENVVLICIASKYEFNNITWLDPNYQDFENVEFSTNSLSIIAKLIINEISVDQSGTYSCIGTRTNGSDANQTISITVEEIQPAMIEDHENQNIEVLIHYEVNFTCSAEAVPPPHIEWYKDGRLLLGDQNIKILTSDVAHKSIHSTVIIDRLREEDVGTYDCKVEGTDLSKSYNLAIKEKPSNKAYYLSAIGVIFFFLIVLVVYLAWKIRREKQFRKELAAAGLLNFKEGATKSINPELGIDEQAELLPYDEKFEFPAEKLILGKQLGAGAFGVVYKADARGILNAEETTTVAVKMVKKNADNMYIKALASELKIMVHMGKHVNIVNLLGACTKNVGKRELIVIVEYCKYGNIHNYIFKHRGVFIDQLTDNAEKNLGKVNRGYSSSSANSGNHSDYFGSNQTQETNQTFVNTANTNRSGRVSETSYVQPEWRSNYESDYSFEGLGPRPLCSRDLLAWAFQIARGMEYLASKKVLHGDLAARNVLLSDDNVVKICDFGLARSIYKNDEYQKQENSPLPVKWLAIECMTDRIFSTQSDVWSFGIVLWELFSLAKTPYPNISPQCLLQFLTEGRRLEKPRHADDKLYAVMQRCWEEKPTNRPSFSELQHILGSFLEDNVRNHYVDLNAIYMDANTQRQGEDYLDMVSAPDYNNMVTPSPHHYVNDARSFFPPSPTTLQHDDEGYLQMSPASRQNMFNARNTGTKFDFDSRKLTPKVSDVNNYGSELTPMLTLNNMPRSGSESDQEGNVSPYLNMCPRIEEETDEVFDTKQNNAKNVAPPADSHSNLTYFAFNVNDEKKPQNFANSYINVPNVNGLVK